MIGFKLDKVLLVFAVIYTTALLTTINNPHHVDESTHSFVGLFLRDFFADWIKNPTLSYQKIYDYAMSYLAYYPKISLHYPPLPQIGFSIAYLIFGASLQVSRLVIILSSVALLFAIYEFAYAVSKKRNVALVAALLLMTSPIVINMSILSMQELPFLLFFTLTMRWLYSIKNKKPEIKNYAILSVLMAATTLTKWQAITIFPVVIFYSLIFERKLLRYTAISVLIAAILLSPYYLFLWKTNLLLLPLTANLEADPLDPTWMQAEGWTYYLRALVNYQFLLPVGAITLLAALVYLKRRGKDWEFFATWIFVVYVLMVVVHNKDQRYTMNFLPAFVIPASYALFKIYKKHVKLLLLAVAGLSLIQFALTLNSLVYGFPDVREIAQFVGEEKYGNVLVNTGLGTASPFIFEIAKSGKFDHQVLSPCVIEFLEGSPDELMHKFGVKYIVLDKETAGFTEKQSKFIESINRNVDFEVARDFKRFSVIKNNKYQPEDKNEVCNYICSTRETICSKFKIPSDALK
ncbi:MAG: glycosyltransferase family 39 protein [Candidatus Aenigmarchaeota archaeon]|nr:glycosyltransferase family 39 protein [Candidatus Aenigmarchaeota archaeon]